MLRIAAITLITAASIAAVAQAPSPQAPIAPPDTGLLVNYTYWPTQYVQWVGTELPYSMMELDVDTAGKQPLLYVTLTERATGKRIHYANSDVLVSVAKATGDEAHKAEIAFEPADNSNVGSVTNVRFSMADGKPLQWRFVQGDDDASDARGCSGHQ